MLGSEKRRPAGIEYGLLNPEGMNSDIRLVKFTPVSTITQARGGDIIRFQIQNDGFLDPYSAYIKFQVQCEPGTSEVRFLDRSAHSFINRLVIRSNGVEIERIENYDVIAAMINDMIYSPEQLTQHHWEGFPCQQRRAPTGIAGQLIDDTSTTLWREAVSMLYPASSDVDVMDVGEHAFFKGKSLVLPPATDYTGPLPHANNDTSRRAFTMFEGVKETAAIDYFHRGAAFTAQRQAYNDAVAAGKVLAYPNIGYLGGKAVMPVNYADTGKLEMQEMSVREFIIPIYSGFLGVLMPSKKFIPLMALPLDIEFTLNPHALYSSNGADEFVRGDRRYTVTRFEIISHVLFFDQEVNLHLENTIANYGLYLHCNSFQLAPVTTISPAHNNGGGTVPAVIQIGMTHKSINSIHVVFFYNDYETNPCARKLHFVSHNLKRLQVRNGPNYIPSEPITAADANLSSGDTMRFGHIALLVELFKAWNKLHAPALDTLITKHNYGNDMMGLQNKPLLTPFDFDTDYRGVNVAANNRINFLPDGNNDAGIEAGYLTTRKNTIRAIHFNMMAKQGNVGRTQYGINLEGEELGTDKSLITGRAAQTPFDLQLQGTKSEGYSSYCNVWLRHDYIVSIRPDLVIQIGGR